MSVKKLIETKSQPVDYANPPLSQQVRDLLARAGLSQRQGARELGIDERTMRYWCAGEHDPPSMALLALQKIVDARRRIEEPNKVYVAERTEPTYLHMVESSRTGSGSSLQAEQPLDRGDFLFLSVVPKGADAANGQGFYMNRDEAVRLRDFIDVKLQESRDETNQ